MTEQKPDFFENPFSKITLPQEDGGATSPEIAAKTTATPKRKRVVLPYVLFAIFILTALPGPLFLVSFLLPGPLKEAKTIIIPRGSSVQEISQILDENNLLIHPLIFRATSRLMAEDRLKAGEYQFTPEQSAVDITAMLRDGKTVVRQFTAPEGLTSEEIIGLLRAVPALTGDIGQIPEEGSLLPETYRYDYGDARASVLERMQKDSKDALAQLWKKREEGHLLSSPREILILASIVEKETGKKPEERAKVAGVFLNRLRRNMPLQTDPTVIYALTQGKGPLGRSLTRADLATPSPYNTYLRAGLPPGPICNPGKAAIEAALNPEKHDLLYFVADGSGGHAFARTLEEHNKNVTRWLSLKRP